MVFTTSENLYTEKKQINANTFLVENVGDFDHFNKVEKMALQVPIDFPDVGPPIIGFIGALDNYKVDFDLIKYVARNRPDWTIILIGSKMNSREDKSELPRRNNIFYLGRKKIRGVTKLHIKVQCLHNSLQNKWLYGACFPN